MNTDCKVSDKFRFLVVGAGRGGTSLLAGLLDYHPMIEVAFEFGAKAYLRGKKIPIEGSDSFHRRVEAFVNACHKKATDSPAQIWGNKITTEQLYGLEKHNIYNPGDRVDVLNTFFNHYLRGKKIIFILRDGRNCIQSKVQRTGQSFEKAAKWWKHSVECYRFLRTRHSDNICIRFEDLVVKPSDTLKEICGFIGFSYHPVMLTGTKNRKMRHEYRQEGIDISRVNPQQLPSPILEMIHDDLRYCNYL